MASAAKSSKYAKKKILISFFLINANKNYTKILIISSKLKYKVAARNT